MTDTEQIPETPEQDPQEEKRYYRIRFREEGPETTTESSHPPFLPGELVMVRTDHGQEPAVISARTPSACLCQQKRDIALPLLRRLQPNEKQAYEAILRAEKAAFWKCRALIEKHQLEMNLVRVEKYFTGSKIIFFFTADNRVDFRELVKDLVQEFRTRVEMRQIGVRHETKMLGGLGSCGRELCCTSFIQKFDSVSIKMAKEQDLPLNPAKISGVCNRLLCCLTFEFQTYKNLRRKMPKQDSHVLYQGEECKVKRQIPLQEKVVLWKQGGEELHLEKEEWLNLEKVKGDNPPKKKKKQEGQEAPQEQTEPTKTAKQ